MHQACDPCRIFAPSFEIAANSYAAVAEPNRLYFASLDYKRGAEVFAKVLTLFSACLHDAAACSHWCGCAAETVVGSRHPPLPADAGQTVHAGLPSRHVQIREIRPFAVRLFSPTFFAPAFQPISSRCVSSLLCLCSAGFEAEDFLRWVEQIVGREIPVVKPFDFSKLLTFVFFATVAFSVWNFFGRRLLELAKYWQPWALASLVCSL